jgi:hypothetical protein
VSWFRNRRDSWNVQRAAASLGDTFKARALPGGTVIVSIKDDATGRWAEVEFGNGDIDLMLAVLRQAQARSRRRFVKPS